MDEVLVRCHHCGFGMSAKMNYCHNCGNPMLSLERFATYGLLVSVRDNKYGYINTTRRIIIPHQYEDARLFSDGVAAVKINGKWGYIDTTGTAIISPQYDDATDFIYGFAQVKMGHKWYCINHNDKCVFVITYKSNDAFRDGDGSVWSNNMKIQPYDYTNFIIISAYEDIKKLSQNVFMVSRNGKFGIINGWGDEIVSPQYDKIDYPFEGYAAVQLDNKWGFIDQKGIRIIPCIYDTVRRFRNGTVAVGKRAPSTGGIKYGISNQSGEIVISLKYDDIGNLRFGQVPVKVGNKWGYIDTSEKITTPIKWDSASDFDGAGIAIATLKGRRDDGIEYVKSYDVNTYGEVKLRKTKYIDKYDSRGYSQEELNDMYLAAYDGIPEATWNTD